MNFRSLKGKVFDRSRQMGLRVFAVYLLFLCCLSPSAGMLIAGGPDEILTIGGTGSGLGGLQEVARAFRKEHPEIMIRFVPSLGSSGGIKAVLFGSLDLAVSARPLTEQEQEQGAEAVEYARTPFVFATAGRETALTMKQITAIYSGETLTWPDGTALRLILRPSNDTDIALLMGMSLEMEKAVQKALQREGMLLAMTDQENADMLSKIKGSFGATTFAQILSEKRRLRPLVLDGVRPSLRALARGVYPFYKVFYAVIGRTSKGATRRFVEYLNTPEARETLMRTGHLVLPRSK